MELEHYKDFEHVPGTIRAYMDTLKLQGEIAKAARAMLERMVKRRGPIGRYGYLTTLNAVLEDLDKTELRLTRMLEVIGGVALYGFTYSHPKMYVRLYREFCDLGLWVKLSPDYLSTTNERVLEKMPEASLRAFELVQVAHQLANFSSDQERARLATYPQHPKPIASVSLFIATLKIAMGARQQIEDYAQELGDQALEDLELTYKNSGVNAPLFLVWKQLHLLTRDYSLDQIVRLLQDTTFLEIMAIAESTPSHLREDKVLRRTLGEKDLLEKIGPEAFPDFLSEWHNAGRPKDWSAFHEAGGTADDWEFLQLLEQEELERSMASKPSPQPCTRLSEEPTPQATGNKRHHHSYRPPKPKQIDFDALRRKLNVTSTFAALGEDRLRHIIVEGFLRHGDRLPRSLTDCEGRDEKKLWKQCRTVFGSRRELKKFLGQLETEHLLTREGKRLRLKKPSGRYTQARQQITHIETLITATHAS